MQAPLRWQPFLRQLCNLCLPSSRCTSEPKERRPPCFCTLIQLTLSWRSSSESRNYFNRCSPPYLLSKLECKHCLEPGVPSIKTSPQLSAASITAWLAGDGRLLLNDQHNQWLLSQIGLHKCRRGCIYQDHDVVCSNYRKRHLMLRRQAHAWLRLQSLDLVWFLQH